MLSPEFIRGINDCCTTQHQRMVEQGFWSSDGTPKGVENLSIGNKVALICGELSGEFLEAHRKGQGGEPDEHCPAYTKAEIEVADAVIRIFDLSGRLSLRLGDAIKAKMMFNLSRPYRHGKAF